MSHIFKCIVCVLGLFVSLDGFAQHPELDVQINSTNADYFEIALTNASPTNTYTLVCATNLIDDVGQDESVRLGSAPDLVYFSASATGTMSFFWTRESSEEDFDSDGLHNVDEFLTYSTDAEDSDSEDDGMTDGWEATNGLDPLVDDGREDADWDGIDNLDEMSLQTGPTNYNTYVYLHEQTLLGGPLYTNENLMADLAIEYDGSQYRMSFTGDTGSIYKLLWLEMFVSEMGVTNVVATNEVFLTATGSLQYTDEYTFNPPESNGTSYIEVPFGPSASYGFWGLNGYQTSSGLADLTNRFTLTTFQTAAASTWAARHLLPTAVVAGVKVTLRMTSDLANTYPDFDITIWKAQLLQWTTNASDYAALLGFISNGTFAGHMLLDDITNFTGIDPTAADLEEMARYSKELFPGLMTFVRQKATLMPTPSNGYYTNVDACVNQYTAYTNFSDGDVETYAAVQAAAAREKRLGIINGLNIADGGNGSSGQQGWRATHHAMSAEEIIEYGSVLATVPDCGMFLCWEYDGTEVWPDGTIGADYFNQPAIEAALAYLGRLMAHHQHVRLLK